MCVDDLECVRRCIIVFYVGILLCVCAMCCVYFFWWKKVLQEVCYVSVSHRYISIVCVCVSLWVPATYVYSIGFYQCFPLPSVHSRTKKKKKREKMKDPIAYTHGGSETFSAASRKHTKDACAPDMQLLWTKITPLHQRARYTSTPPRVPELDNPELRGPITKHIEAPNPSGVIEHDTASDLEDWWTENSRSGN